MLARGWSDEFTIFYTLLWRARFLGIGAYIHVTCRLNAVAMILPLDAPCLMPDTSLILHAFPPKTYAHHAPPSSPLT